MEILIFKWSLVDYKSELFKLNKEGKEQFINRYSSLDIDGTGIEFWKQEESIYNSFVEYWNDFVREPFWLNNYPDYVHQDYKPIIREFLWGIDQETISSSEELQLDYWIDTIVNED